MRPILCAGILAILLSAVLALPAGRAAAQPADAAGAGPAPAPVAQEGAPVASLVFARPLGDGPVYRVRIEGPIDAALANYVHRALADAEAGGASLVLFDVDTFGGLIDAADQIRTAILATPIPTVAYVDRNAASAGALIALAADRIVMAPGASMGAATAVDTSGAYATEKVQSYVRSLMRSTAEANGRDPRLAEAMVDERIEIPGVVEAGRLLSLSAREAVRLGMADAELPTVTAVVAAAGASGRPLVQHAASRPERLLRFLGSPAVATILLLMMLGGLYFELHAPGLSLAGGIALLGAALFFAPHYLLGLVESWEIVVFGLGVAFLLVEVFLIPGHGFMGIVGTVLMILSLIAALVGNVGLDFPGAHELVKATATLAAAVVLTIVLAFSLGRYLPRSTRFQHLILSSELAGAQGYTSAPTDDTLLGLRGRAVTPLRPAGTAEIDGRRIDVVSDGAFIAAGTDVEVARVRGARVEVHPVRAPQAAPAT